MAVTQYGFHEKLINRFEGLLNGSITDVSTSITLVDATGLPAQGFFRLLIEDEIIICSSVSSNTVTVFERGAEGTTAASHADATAVSCVLTNGGLQRYLLSNNDGCAAYTEDTTFDDSQAWPTPLGRLTNQNSNLTASSFTWHNQGSATLTDSAGGLVMTVPKESGFNLRGVTITPPSTPFMFTARFRFCIAPDNPMGGNSTFWGLWFRDGTGKLVTLVNRAGSSMAMLEWTDWNTFSSSVDTELDCHDVNHMWMRFEDDGTNHQGYFSIDGSNWSKDSSIWWRQSRTAHLAASGQTIGFFMSSSSSGGGSGAGNSGSGPATGTLSIESFHVEAL